MQPKKMHSSRCWRVGLGTMPAKCREFEEDVRRISRREIRDRVYGGHCGTGNDLPRCGHLASAMRSLRVPTRLSERVRDSQSGGHGCFLRYRPRHQQSRRGASREPDYGSHKGDNARALWGVGVRSPAVVGHCRPARSRHFGRRGARVGIDLSGSRPGQLGLGVGVFISAEQKHDRGRWRHCADQ